MENEKEEHAQEKLEDASQKMPEREFLRTWHGRKMALMVGFLLIILVVVLGSFTIGRFSKDEIGKNHFDCGMAGWVAGGRMMRGGFGDGAKKGLGLRAGNVSGKIKSISGNNVVVDNNGTDVTVTISIDTSFVKNDKIAKQSDLKIGYTILVTGPSKSDGSVTATLIIIQS